MFKHICNTIGAVVFAAFILGVSVDNSNNKSERM